MHKLNKKFFKISINSLKFIQVSLVFLSFFIILYWLFQLGGASFIKPLAPFFEWIKDFTHIFYKRTVAIDQVEIDFSFLIATFTILLFVWLLKFVVEYIEFAETKYDSIHKQLKKKTEDLFNTVLKQEYIMNETKNNNYFMLVKFEAKNLSQDSFFTKTTNIGVEEQQTKALNELINNINYNFPCEKELLKDGVFLYFNNFNDIDNVLFYIEHIIITIKRKYQAENWQIDTNIGIDSYACQKEIMNKTEDLIMLTKIGLKNKITCLASFKQRYSMLRNPKYSVEGYGIYKIFDNKEVFYLRSLR